MTSKSRLPVSFVFLLKYCKAIKKNSSARKECTGVIFFFFSLKNKCLFTSPENTMYINSTTSWEWVGEGKDIQKLDVVKVTGFTHYISLVLRISRHVHNTPILWVFFFFFLGNNEASFYMWCFILSFRGSCEAASATDSGRPQCRCRGSRAETCREGPIRRCRTRR